MKKIFRVKHRFVEQGLEAALEKCTAERSHTRKADGDFEAHLVALSCSAPPAGHARWSLRLPAGRMVALQYVEHGKQAQRSTGGRMACFGRQVVRNAG